MAKALGTVALLLGDEVVVKVRHNTTLTDLHEQLDKACKDGRIQDVDGYDVTAHYSPDLPAGDYPIKRSIGGPKNLILVHCPASKMRSAVSMLFNTRRPSSMFMRLLCAPHSTVSMLLWCCATCYATC